MNHLQMRLLKQLCDKHGLDYQLIDDTLTYWENKAFLTSQVIDVRTEKNMDTWESDEEEYMKNCFLWHYLYCIREGKTQSRVIGKALQGRREFSLRAFVLKHDT